VKANGAGGGEGAPLRGVGVPPVEVWGCRLGDGTIELAVDLADQTEGVVVIAEPDVEAVLLDAPVRSPTARPLAPDAPAPLVDRDRLDPIGELR
jgi:hypothetical protein